MSLYRLIAPSFCSVVRDFKAIGRNIVDSHILIDDFKRKFPFDYNTGLSKFKGKVKQYHGYLGRMLLSNKFGPVKHLGFVNSTNCFGLISKNSSWELL